MCYNIILYIWIFYQITFSYKSLFQQNLIALLNILLKLSDKKLKIISKISSFWFKILENNIVITLQNLSENVKNYKFYYNPHNYTFI